MKGDVGEEEAPVSEEKLLAYGKSRDGENMKKILRAFAHKAARAHCTPLSLAAALCTSK